MKKMITLLLCLLLLPVSVALADNASLEGTTWELGMIAVIETEEMFDKDYIEENGLMISFQFEANGEVTLTTPDVVYNGTYQLDGDELDLDFGEDGHIWTTINEGEYGVYIFSFVSIFAEGQIHLFTLASGTFGGTAPAAPDPEPPAAEPTPQPQQPEAEEPETQEPEIPATSQNVPELEGTTWEIVRAESPDGVLDRNDLVRIDYLLEFQFRRNGSVICRFKNDSDWLEERGTYQLTGNELSIDIPSLPPMVTTIQDGLFTITNFNNTGEDYTFRQSSSPSQASGPGMPRWVRDALVGGALGAVVGLVMWLIGKKKKKKKAAAAAAANMPAGVDPAHHAYYQTPTPASVVPPTSAGTAPIDTQRQLYCQSGPLVGATFPVNTPLRIGRDPNLCQIVFPAEANGISALHCEVQPQPSGILLIDHGSSHGTYLQNGRKLNASESVVLNPGDGFYLAENQNMFRVY